MIYLLILEKKRFKDCYRKSFMGSLICVDNFFKFGVPSQKCEQIKCFGYFAFYVPVQNPPVLLLTA